MSPDSAAEAFLARRRAGARGELYENPSKHIDGRGSSVRDNLRITLSILNQQE
jgi:hypothetical protein